MRLILPAIFLLCSLQGWSQRFGDQIPQIRRYYFNEIYDSVHGITIYNNLIEPLGGDSIRYNKAGYNMQGWTEDFYMSGKTLHKGYYVDGRLKLFKNFYESGQLERSFINPNPLQCTLDVYYENGSQKSKTLFYDGKPQKYYEYYQSGNPKMLVENEKDMRYHTLRKTWFDNGQTEDVIELKDKKEFIFSQKKYFKNGQLKEEGLLKLGSGESKYIKEGTWTFYDESGKNKRTEKFN
jgi:antitoxin component YwqK of YwqJK toxin-antitoxin module